MLHSKGCVCLELGKNGAFSVPESLRSSTLQSHSNAIYSFRGVFLLGEYFLLWYPHYVFYSKSKIKKDMSS